MNLAVVGVGGAGGLVVDRLLAVESATGRSLAGERVLAVDTDQAALDGLEHVPAEGRLAIGAVGTVGADEGDDGEPTAHDPERGVAAARDARGELADAVGALHLPAVDAVLVVAGLAGGTGGGAGAVVVDTLQDLVDAPVYALAVLPAETEGRSAALAAVRSLRSVVEAADAVIGFDDGAWGPADPDGPGAYREANDALARRVVALLGGGDAPGDAVAEHRLDPSDVVRTLEPGGLATIGYASIDVPAAGGQGGRLSSLLGRGSGAGGDDEDEPDADDIAYLARRAVRGKLTLPGDVASAERGLIVRSGPSRALAGTGFEDGRYWLEGEADTVEVLAGAVPHESAAHLESAVLLSNVTSVPSVEALQALALDG